jgi:DNA repair exonuclease SbcCD ATPase subunit
MKLRKWLKLASLLTGFCLGAISGVAQPQGQQTSSQQQSGDPVADAARKAREQQKAQPKPKKVYTEDDIPPRLGSTDSGSTTGQAANSEQAGAGNAQPAGGGTSAAGGKDDAETAWRKRFAEQRNKIAAAEKELDVLQRESEKAQVQYYNDPQKALMEQNTRKDINDKNAKIDQKKQEIASLKQQLSDLEDELRKSGGDPGWARE